MVFVSSTFLDNESREYENYFRFAFIFHSGNLNLNTNLSNNYLLIETLHELGILDKEIYQFS